MRTKSIDIKKSTITVTFEADLKNYIDSNTISDVLALSLLTGFYNPLRGVSSSDAPIDLDVLEEFKIDFENILYSMKKKMDVDPSLANSIGKIKG